MDTIFPEVISTANFVKKFYFLDYFYILLKSVEKYETQIEVFERFKELKDIFQLGESKYRKLSFDDSEIPTQKQLSKFWYTFEQVLHEAVSYDLVEVKNENSEFDLIKHDKERNKLIHLKDKGEVALDEYEKGKFAFSIFLFKLMEEKHKAFYEIVKLCYGDSKLKNGLLVFPIYSGLKLGCEKSTFTSNQSVLDFSNKLINKLESDINEFTHKIVNLKTAEEKLIVKLRQDGIIGDNPDDKFEQSKYNSALSRFRKYWLEYFLKDIYNYKFSFSTFSIWIERAKQIGILQTTEFYPDFSGRLVFPTSVILEKGSMLSADFTKIFEYQTGEALYLHIPDWNNSKNQENFLKVLQEEFIFLQRTAKTHFVNLLDIKERVCFKKRIPGFVFDDFLGKAYELNLKGRTLVKISLETDKLPQETNALYLKREPILINGKYKNIIAINYGGI